MRALATTRIVVFLTRHAGGAEAVAARAIGASYRAVGRRALATHEIDAFLAELAAAGVEVIEAAASPRACRGASALALPAPVAPAAVPSAPATLPKPVESEWLSFSEIVLKTQKIRGPNSR